MALILGTLFVILGCGKKAAPASTTSVPEPQASAPEPAKGLDESAAERPVVKHTELPSPTLALKATDGAAGIEKPAPTIKVDRAENSAAKKTGTSTPKEQPLAKSGDDKAESAKAQKEESAAYEAIAAARKASDGNTPCESALAGVIEVVRTLQERLGKDAPVHMPDETTFLKTCSTLPEATQRCLVPKYALEHQAECNKTQSNLSAKDRAALSDLASDIGSQ